MEAFKRAEAVPKEYHVQMSRWEIPKFSYFGEVERDISRNGKADVGDTSSFEVGGTKLFWLRWNLCFSLRAMYDFRLLPLFRAGHIRLYQIFSAKHQKGWK